MAKVLTTAPTAAIAVLALTAATQKVPTSKILQIISNARSKAVEVEALHAAIIKVPPSKIAAIETNAASEAQKVAELKAQIDALENRTITVCTAVLKTVGGLGGAVSKAISLGGNASGRKSGAAEPSLVGEGRGPEYIIDGRTGQGTKVARRR